MPENVFVSLVGLAHTHLNAHTATHKIKFHLPNNGKCGKLANYYIEMDEIGLTIYATATPPNIVKLIKINVHFVQINRFSAV